MTFQIQGSGCCSRDHKAILMMDAREHRPPALWVTQFLKMSHLLSSGAHFDQQCLFLIQSETQRLISHDHSLSEDHSVKRCAGIHKQEELSAAEFLMPCFKNSGFCSVREINRLSILETSSHHTDGVYDLRKELTLGFLDKERSGSWTRRFMLFCLHSSLFTSRSVPEVTVSWLGRPAGMLSQKRNAKPGWGGVNGTCSDSGVIEQVLLFQRTYLDGCINRNRLCGGSATFLPRFWMLRFHVFHVVCYYAWNFLWLTLSHSSVTSNCLKPCNYTGRAINTHLQRCVLANLELLNVRAVRLW